MLAIFILNGRLCDLFHLTLQRYNIFIAVHEYFPSFFHFSAVMMALVTMVMVMMVKIENGLSKSATII